MDTIKNPYIKLRTAYIATILTILAILFLFVYLGFENRKSAYASSRLLAKEISRKAASEAEIYLSSAISSARILEQKAQLYKKYGADRIEIIRMLKNSLENDLNFIGAWTMWETNAFDNKDKSFSTDSLYDSLGTMSVCFFKYKNKILFEKNEPVDFKKDFYTIPKKLKKEVIIEPYYYQYHGHAQIFYQTSAIVPVMLDTTFLGVFGIDIGLDSLTVRLNRAKLYHSGYLSLFSPEGIIACHVDTSCINTNIHEYIEDDDNLLFKSISNGKEVESEHYSKIFNQKVFRFFYPVKIGEGIKKWTILAEIPVNAATKKSRQLLYVAIISLVLGISLILFLIFNIIDRKRYEKTILDSVKQVDESNKQITDSERNYKEIFNSTFESIFILDAETGKILDVNDMAITLFGYSNKSEILECGITDLSLSSELSIDPIICRYALKSISEGTQVIEWQAKKKNAEIFWTEISLKSSQIGGKNKILAVVRDISERKLVEQILKESELRYHSLFENAQIGIYQTSPDGQILKANPAIIKMLGFDSLEDLKTRNLENDDVFAVSTRNLFKEIIEREGSIVGFESNWKTKNGDIITVIENASAVKDNLGKIIYYDGFVENITKRKIAENELAKYKDMLEILVKERTEELENTNEELIQVNEELYAQREQLEMAFDNLQKAQKQLILSEKMSSLGTLAAGVAHEINNPLNFIAVGIMALENYFNENLKEHISNVAIMLHGIQEGVNRADAIVSSLNHYSRNDDLPVMECDIHLIIDNCLIMLQGFLKNKITVEKKYSPNPCVLVGNEGKLHQVFLSILTNSIQAIDKKGSIIILTKLKKVEIEITISDTGTGISKENLPKVFDPFFTTKEPGKGTGLGLAITYNIIQEHNGKIEIHSKEGKGSTVTIHLPLDTFG